MKILIIGATSGIGRALCHYYSKENNIVIATGRREKLLQELSETNNTIIVQKMDITDLTNTSEMIVHIWKEVQQIDIAFVCAGIGELNPNFQHDINASTINTNVVGWTNVVDSLYSKFEQQSYGHLVTITSLNSLRGEPIAPAYSASKAFQHNYTEALSKKAFSQKNKIQVSEICPGLVDTAMAKGEGLFWVMPVEKAVQQIIKAINRKTHYCVITKRWRIIAFILKHLPWCIYKRL